MNNREMMLPDNRYLELVGRLNRFYGQVARDQNQSIMKQISGKTVLEVGCGYGLLIDQVNIRGRAFGVDHDFDAVHTGKQVFNNDLVNSDSYSLCFPNKSVDSIVLRETAHHLDMEKALPELIRVAKKEIIIFEPNSIFLVKAARKIIRHEDYEAPLLELKRVLEKNGLTIKGISFRDILAFPLSGGLVGYELIPNVKWLGSLLLWFDHFLVNIFSSLGIESFFCWRYLVIASMLEG